MWRKHGMKYARMSFEYGFSVVCGKSINRAWAGIERNAYPCKAKPQAVRSHLPAKWMKLKS